MLEIAEGGYTDARLAWYLMWDNRVPTSLRMLFFLASAMQVLLWVVNLFIPDPLPYLDELILNPVTNQVVINKLFVELSPQWLVNDYRDWFEQQGRRPRNSRQNNGNNSTQEVQYGMIQKRRGGRNG